MKTHLLKLTVILAGLIVLCGIGSCNTLLVPTSISPVNTKLATATVVLPTSTISATPTPILTPTLIPPTPTAIPTLNPQEASAEILGSLAGEICSFPCWWGLTPGKTRIVDAQNYLNRFSTLPGAGPIFRENEGYISYEVSQSESLDLDIYLEFEGEHEIIDWLQVNLQMSQIVTYTDGQSGSEISWNDSNLAELIKPYSLARVLSVYGPPSEVLVFTHQAAMLNQPHPLSLVVFYSEHGFMIEYVANAEYEGTQPNLSIMGCPSLAFPYFWFWSPSEEITLRDVVSWIDGYQLSERWLTLGKFKSLEDATGMNIEELYSLYMTNENACIKTPASIWPMPGE